MQDCITRRLTALPLLTLSLLSMTLAACESDLELIAPDPEIFVVGTDGGAVVTLNHGATFSTVYNQD